MAPLCKDSSASVGLAYHPALAPWLDRAPDEVERLEVVAERFYDGGMRRLRVLSERFPLLVHTRRLSLAAPGPHDAIELKRLSALVSEANPLWVSDHLGFRYAPGVDLGSPCPVALDRRTLDLVVERALRVVERCGTPFLIENISSPIVIMSSMSEPEFLNRFCEITGCGVLLDLTGLYVGARNHGFDSGAWLDELDRSHVVQIHVGGCREVEGRWDDTHDAPIVDDVWELLREALKGAAVKAVILEWEARFPPTSVLKAELHGIKALTRTHERGRAGN